MAMYGGNREIRNAIIFLPDKQLVVTCYRGIKSAPRRGQPERLARRGIEVIVRRPKSSAFRTGKIP